MTHKHDHNETMGQVYDRGLARAEKCSVPTMSMDR
jgi:hypothetical protein